MQTEWQMRKRIGFVWTMIPVLPPSHHVDENSNVTPVVAFVPVSRLTPSFTSVTVPLLLLLHFTRIPIPEIQSYTSVPTSVLPILPIDISRILHPNKDLTIFTHSFIITDSFIHSFIRITDTPSAIRICHIPHRTPLKSMIYSFHVISPAVTLRSPHFMSLP